MITAANIGICPVLDLLSFSLVAWPVRPDLWKLCREVVSRTADKHCSTWLPACQVPPARFELAPSGLEDRCPSVGPRGLDWRFVCSWLCPTNKKDRSLAIPLSYITYVPKGGL